MLKIHMFKIILYMFLPRTAALHALHTKIIITLWENMETEILRKNSIFICFQVKGICTWHNNIIKLKKKTRN